MEMYVYITLLLSALIHPFVVVMLPYLWGETVSEFGMTLVMIVPFGWFVSLLWFIPCLALGRFFIKTAVKIKAGIQYKFIVWLFLAGIMVTALFILPGLVFNVSVEGDFFLWTSGLILSIWIASAIRYRYFVRMVNQNTG